MPFYPKQRGDRIGRFQSPDNMSCGRKGKATGEDLLGRNALTSPNCKALTGTFTPLPRVRVLLHSMAGWMTGAYCKTRHRILEGPEIYLFRHRVIMWQGLFNCDLGVAAAGIISERSGG